ncbi:hypothetical protein [Pseudomonas syringae]|uniref:WD40 repeat protein n=2 Tax=Pseudomonas syringae TaxID=317 RepID=A0AAN4TML7_PSESF|nr:hypothetical protein [Pseudomonas syringae]EPM69863.1 hypothetical protein A3SM_28448 [Pseudomonas syringae pv. actinidiae ICMP 18886]EPN67597.1 hypothetical protein A234_28666 [Pseudomonas syringae pv. actinidiae ICMP 19101]EPN69400.1 hypothetical protein A235_06697 [Pseudomonas syringae pv. actinidiae ICMP 19079]MDG6421568.1 hypothetical protein [Pseudomonas syringae pv. actinidiae]MDG6427063.1 hypothetical protein [Pseudomonas syringae pv. actinidiae]
MMEDRHEDTGATRLRELENVKLLLSYKKFYGEVGSAEEILSDTADINLLRVLSALSFRHDEERTFSKWSVDNVCHTSEQHELAKSGVIFSRRTLWLFWKVVLRASSQASASPRNDRLSLITLHKAFLANNDVDDSEADDDSQYFVKLSVSNYRDNVLRKFYRSQQVFLLDGFMKPHVRKFEELHNIDIDIYLNFLYRVISRAYQNSEAGGSLNSIGSRWGVDLVVESQEIGIPIDVLVRLMMLISFTPVEGAEFSEDTASDFDDFSLFRHRPFVRISDTHYFPVEGKLVEELLFENLFHKIYDAGGKDPKYLTDFGEAFETYAQDLTELFSLLQSGNIYKYIPEFVYGKPRAKSSDIFIKAEADKTVLAIEVKSARFLDAVVSTANNPKAVNDSFDKLVIRPLSQAYESLGKILTKKAHPEIVEGYKYLMICVTMNDIPISLQRFSIVDQDGEDISWLFYAVNIETYELLLAVAAEVDDYTLYDILRNVDGVRNRMSIKTALSRTFGYRTDQGRLFSAIQDRVFRKHLSWFASACGR